MGKTAKSGKAGRNKGDDLAKKRATERHKKIISDRQARQADHAKMSREAVLGALTLIADKMGAPFLKQLHYKVGLVRGSITPTRFKRDIIRYADSFVVNKKDHARYESYRQMNLLEFIVVMNKELL